MRDKYETTKWSEYLEEHGWLDTKAAMKVVGYTEQEIKDFARAINFYPDPIKSKDASLQFLNDIWEEKVGKIK